MSKFDREIQAALEADGEKLFQLTGEDHGPFYFDDDTAYAPCPCCFESCGYRGEWTTGWDDPGSFIQSRDPCPECNGTGMVPCDMAGPEDRDEDLYDEGYEHSLDSQAGAS